MISYGKQTIDQNDKDKVLEALNSDWLTQGSLVEKFENDLKTYFLAKHCTAVSNGTAALHLTGLALGWKPGDIIITSPITFLASANCIIYSGATPDFVDINPITYTIDLNQLEKKLKYYRSRGQNIKAIIGVDYAGHPCHWRELRQLANKYELQLVNDNCHALGASYYDDKGYASKYADVVTQSFHPVKHITTGEGGAILTNNSKVDEKVRRLRSHGMTKSKSSLEKDDGPWYYEMHDIGFNYRITDFQCALGINQLKKLDQFVIKRRKIAELYDKAFAENSILITPSTKNKIIHSYHLYPLRIDFENTEMDKRKFCSMMKKNKVLIQVHYIPVHQQPYYRKNFGFKRNDFPNALNFYEQEVSLPMFPSLSKNNQNSIIDLINQYYADK